MSALEAQNQALEAKEEKIDRLQALSALGGSTACCRPC